MIRPVIGVIKLFAFALMTLAIVFIQVIVMAISKKDTNFLMPKIWHWCICRIMRIEISVEGSEHSGGQTLYMSNHLSYLDIPVLGAHLNNASFVAKSEVAKWPVFGFLSKLQNTAFIDRRASKIVEERTKIGKRIGRDHSLILFPEATSTDGLSVRPFKSSLFSLAQEQGDLVIQPITLRLETANGITPSNLAERRIYTWPLEDDIEMPVHLWRFAKSRGARLSLVFHPVIKPDDFNDRKTLAKACEKSVSSTLTTS